MFNSTLIPGAALLAIIAAVVSLLAILALHILSSEYAPSWRMISEYANGNHGWILSLMFYAWAVSTFALIVALGPLAQTWLGLVGLGFLLLAGVGELMGGLFDINHKLHGAAFALGVPSLAIAAILLTIAGRRVGLALPIWAGALPILSMLLMAVSMFMFFSALKAHGVEMGPDQQPLDALPAGVHVWNGWANRILVIAYLGWAMIAANAMRALAE